MSHTPETDRLIKELNQKQNPKPTIYYLKNHACSLESERNELRKTLQQTITLANEYLDAKIKAERERDRANEELHLQLISYAKLFDQAEAIRIERDSLKKILDTNNTK
jgi:hypothetical protein